MIRVGENSGEIRTYRVEPLCWIFFLAHLFFPGQEYAV